MTTCPCGCGWATETVDGRLVARHGRVAIEVPTGLDKSQGPCNGCGAQTRRYGEGGRPLCPRCAPPASPDPTRQS